MTNLHKCLLVGVAIMVTTLFLSALMAYYWPALFFVLYFTRNIVKLIKSTYEAFKFTDGREIHSFGDLYEFGRDLVQHRADKEYERMTKSLAKIREDGL